MNWKLIFPVIAVSLFAACNNSSKKSEEKTDSTGTTMKMDTTSHMNMNTTEVPPLPAVPDGARVFFKNLKDGETVKSPFQVKFGTDKIRVDTAGPVVAGSGHHHLMIDDGDSLTMGTMVAKDSTHIHYGKGQTETQLTLAPGKHKLTLQFADGLHRSYGGRLSATISVNVKK